jgi:hypothetical protein
MPETNMKTAILKLFLLAAISAAATCQSAMAQTGSYGQPSPPSITEEVGPVYGLGWGYGPSTAAESWYRGYADLVRAWGQNNYYNSVAQVYWEEAREKAIANRTARVEQFFALRNFNEQQRFGAIAKRRLSKERLVALSRKAAPQRLAEEHWDAAADGLAWPTALKGDSFAASSARLDELFRVRRLDGLDEAQHNEIDGLVKEMTEALKGMVRQVKPSEYAAAKRFLTSVGYEANFELPRGERLAKR